MKKLSMLAAAVVLALLSAQPLWARTCPKVIKEGRDSLAKAKLSKTESDKVKTLLDDADKAHDSGDHDQAIKKAKQALALLNKK